MQCLGPLRGTHNLKVVVIPDRVVDVRTLYELVSYVR